MCIYIWVSILGCRDYLGLRFEDLGCRQRACVGIFAYMNGFYDLGLGFRVYGLVKV